MPMNWTSEADAKLMAKIIQFCDVKPSGAQMSEIAKAMGAAVTVKAISHRLTHFRKLGGGGGTAKAAPTASTQQANGSKNSHRVVKPRFRSPTKNGRGGKKAKAELSGQGTPSPPPATAVRGEGDGDDGELPTPPATGRTRRTESNHDYAEAEVEENGEGGEDGEVEGLNDRVKIEVGEDVGEGLRQGAEDEEVF